MIDWLKNDLLLFMLVKTIQEICQYSPKSLQRRKAMNKLLREIQQLPKLGKSGDIHRLDAFNLTCEYVCNNLCSKFNTTQPDVEKRFVQWFNKTFYWRLHDLKNSPKNTKVKFLSLDRTLGENQNTKLVDLLATDGLNPPHRDGLDIYIEQIEKTRQEDLSCQIENYFTEDPDKKLSNCHPKKSPQCNCQYLVKRHLLQNPAEKLSTIAKELKINYQTLNSHWKRSCLPELQKIAMELGYGHE